MEETNLTKSLIDKSLKQIQDCNVTLSMLISSLELNNKLNDECLDEIFEKIETLNLRLNSVKKKKDILYNIISEFNEDDLDESEECDEENEDLEEDEDLENGNDENEDESEEARIISLFLNFINKNPEKIKILKGFIK